MELEEVKKRLDAIISAACSECTNSDYDEVNHNVGRDLFLSNGGLPPRTTPPEPLILTVEEERDMQEAMEMFRSNDD